MPVFFCCFLYSFLCPFVNSSNTARLLVLEPLARLLILETHARALILQPMIVPVYWFPYIYTLFGSRTPCPFVCSFSDPCPCVNYPTHVRARLLNPVPMHICWFLNPCLIVDSRTHARLLVLETPCAFVGSRNPLPVCWFSNPCPCVDSRNPCPCVNSPTHARARLLNPVHMFVLWFSNPCPFIDSRAPYACVDSRARLLIPFK